MTDEINPNPEEQADRSEENAVINAFIDSVGLDKIKSFLRDLLVAYESQDEKPAGELNPDESRVRQASTEQLRGTDSQEEPPEVEEAEPDEEPKRGKSVAWRNGRELQVGG